MRLHGIPHSTNVLRVALALGLKGVAVEHVVHAAGDRAGVRAVSGQELVPVLETGDGRVLTDSMTIVAWIDATWPTPPLYPADPKARREVEAFVGFFDHVWKVTPNAIDAAPAGDPRIAAWAAQLRAWQHGFDALLTDRPFLFGETPGAADLCAYPFLRFATSSDPDDDDLFHGVLIAHLSPAPHANLAAWIDRMAALPVA
ncbi:MAG: glutathione S-transferase family protein [Conexibacter sp.]|nr:glutathione S-transferase family protein [Conexibacter sp.]